MNFYEINNEFQKNHNELFSSRSRVTVCRIQEVLYKYHKQTETTTLTQLQFQQQDASTASQQQVLTS
jgi:hypothetical protein